jgi:hypothetical protein
MKIQKVGALFPAATLRAYASVLRTVFRVQEIRYYSYSLHVLFQPATPPAEADLGDDRDALICNAEFDHPLESASHKGH